MYIIYICYVICQSLKDAWQPLITMSSILELRPWLLPLFGSVLCPTRSSENSGSLTKDKSTRTSNMLKHAQTMSNMVKHPHVSRVYHEFPSSRRFRELHISQPFLICLWPELLPKNNRLLWGSSNFGFRFQSTLLYKWRKCTISSCSSRAGSKLSYCDASIPISKSKSAHSESFRSLSLLLSTAKILTYFDCAAFHYLSHAREWRHSHLLGSLASCHMQRSSAAGAHLDASGLAYHEWAKQITGAWNRMDIFGCHWRSLYT